MVWVVPGGGRTLYAGLGLQGRTGPGSVGLIGPWARDLSPSPHPPPPQPGLDPFKPITTQTPNTPHQQYACRRSESTW